MFTKYVRRCVGHLFVFSLVGCLIITVVSGGIGDGGSKCPDASCTPAPMGIQCQPRYERDDGCCPVWYCNNGQTTYGMSKASGGQSGSSYSYSTGSMGGLQPMMPMGNPFGAFGNLFGGLFGR